MAALYSKATTACRSKEKTEMSGHSAILIINPLLVSVAVRAMKTGMWLRYARKNVCTGIWGENKSRNRQRRASNIDQRFIQTVPTSRKTRYLSIKNRNSWLVRETVSVSITTTRITQTNCIGKTSSLLKLNLAVLIVTTVLAKVVLLRFYQYYRRLCCDSFGWYVPAFRKKL